MVAMKIHFFFSPPEEQEDNHHKELSQRHHSTKPNVLSLSLTQISNNITYLLLKITVWRCYKLNYLGERHQGGKEMRVKNLIFICLQQHGSKLHPLHVPNAIKIHPITVNFMMTSQCHYLSRTVLTSR